MWPRSPRAHALCTGRFALSCTCPRGGPKIGSVGSARTCQRVIFRSKPQIGLSVVDLSRKWGVPFEVAVAYGKNPSFLGGLEQREVAYVCGVESTLGVRLPEEVSV